MIYYIKTMNTQRGQYGRIPDAPEPFECPEKFVEEICDHCSEYETCKAEQETEEEDD